jgi:hypothetical protein
VVELIYLCLNSKFNISVTFNTNYIFNRRRRSVDSDTILTDSMNLKILNLLEVLIVIDIHKSK